MNPQRSRLTRRLEKQTKRQIITFLVGIAIILFIFVKFGPFIIGEAGNLIFALKGDKQQSTRPSSVDFLEAPILDSIPQATVDPQITISGKSSYKDGTIEITVNNTSYKNITVDSDGKFKLENVKLSPGDNIIRARIQRDNKSSDFSVDTTIKYSKDAPKLDVSSPSDNQTFTKADQEINVTGKTEADNTVTVNSFRAIVDSDGNFSYYLKLKDGDNEIKITAQNPAGKTTDKTLKVIYRP